MKRIFTHSTLLWRFVAIIVIGVFSFAEVQAQSQCGNIVTCPSCDVTIDVSESGFTLTNASVVDGVIRPSINPTQLNICMTGSGTFTGNVGFLSNTGSNRSNVTLCIGSNITFSGSITAAAGFGGHVINNQGILNLGAFHSNTGVNFNNGAILNNIGVVNFRAVNFNPPPAANPIPIDITNGGRINNLGGGVINANGTLTVGNTGTLENCTAATINAFNSTSSDPNPLNRRTVFLTSSGVILNSGNFNVNDFGAVPGNFFIQGPGSTLNVNGGNINTTNLSVSGNSTYVKITNFAGIGVRGNYSQDGQSTVEGGSNVGSCGGIKVLGNSSITGQATYGNGTFLQMCDNGTVFIDNTTIPSGFDSKGNNANLRINPNPAAYNPLTGCNICNTIPLPITLVYFRAAYVEGQVNLNWATASEEDNDYFTIEKSKDGVSFTEVTRIKGAGNSSGLLTYQSVDIAPYEGTSYYRLKQTDLDGKYSYSRIVPVNAGGSSSRTATIFPNPVAKDGFVQVAVNSEQTGDTYVTVYDQIGKQCFYAKYTGDAIPSIAVKQFSTHSGLYIIQARKGTTLVREKVIVQ